jgi:hypothetical protein
VLLIVIRLQIPPADYVHTKNFRKLNVFTLDMTIVLVTLVTMVITQNIHKICIGIMTR